MTAPARQLDAIHAMLSAGHRNLRIERHTLLLWGIPAGLLFAISELILTPSQFPDITACIGLAGAAGVRTRLDRHGRLVLDAKNQGHA